MNSHMLKVRAERDRRLGERRRDIARMRLQDRRDERTLDYIMMMLYGAALATVVCIALGA